MTTNVLLPFLDKLARCQKASDVNGVMMDAIKVTFACHFGAALFHNESLAVTERAFFGIRESYLEEYEERFRQPGPLPGPLFRAVVTRAAPVHNWQVYREDHWQRAPIWNGCGSSPTSQRPRRSIT